MTQEFSTPTEELLQKLRKLRVLKKDIKEHEDFLEANKKDFAELEAECVIMMDNASMTQTKIDGITMYRKKDQYASIDKEKKEEAWEWLKAQDLAFLIQESVNSRSLMAALKDLPEETLAAKPASIKISPVERIGMRGMK